MQRLKGFLAGVLVALLAGQPSVLTAEQTFAAPEVTAAASSSAQTASERHFLWRLDSGRGRVYLLGSIHLLDESVYPLPSVIELSFAESDVLVLEAIPDMDPAKVQALVGADGIYTDGSTLQGHMQPEDFQLLSRGLARISMDVSLLQPFKPWFAAILLQVTVLQQMGFQMQYGIDWHFYEQAKRLGKPVEELESMEAQVRLLASLTEEQQSLLLRLTVEQLDQLSTEFTKIVELWRKGDVEGLMKLDEQDTRDYPELGRIEDKLLNDRNRAMVEKITRYAQMGRNTFVVVGAAHLAGEKSIINLLQDKGYVLQQL